ncbi:MAG: L-lysine 6-transaminase [Planctomycetes bacterium]|nr:L-lysine 6-transaminase [Planctomycetota bacterium]
MQIHPQNVLEVLKRHQLVDGFPLVLDLERSHGSWLVDGKTGDEYLDCFTCFATWPVGYNHPRLFDQDFQAELARAATHNPSNSDFYTVEMTRFVESFATRVTPEGYPHHFWVSGGTLAVENALKVAFDWKAQKLGRRELTENCDDLVILHFQEAFHGRSGYALSLTNTDPAKIGFFPKFRWPRVHNPKLEFDLHGRISNDIEASERRACEMIEMALRDTRMRVAGILIEPMQGEGGDNHFRPEFLKKLRQYADEYEALLLFDEVQTGFFGSGRPWMWQAKGVRPDVVAFGKKAQICGVYANARVDEVADNVFHRPSRINSTWGGSLADMVRARKLIDIILDEKLHEQVAARGERLIRGLRELGLERGGFSNVRGMGSLVAFTLESPAARDAMFASMRDQRLLALKAGPQAIRFRLPFVITDAEVDSIVARVADALPARTRA